MASTSSYKCLNCNAPLGFDPTSGHWKCHYCFSEFTKEELDTVYKEEQIKEQSNEESSELNSYHCNNCGAEIVADETTSATFCLYCKSPSLIKERFKGEFHPKYVIPFKLTHADAERIYKEWIQKKLFAPTLFKNDEEIEKIKGIYAPFWLFDCETEGYIEGQGTIVTSWRAGKYQYTKTKYYHVERGGRVKYERVPVDASTKLDDKFMVMIEPYDYQTITDFSMHYMTGFFAEKYDVDEKTSEKTMRERVQQFVTDRIRNTVSGYTSFTVSNSYSNLKETTESYALMPVYLLVNEFNDEKHMFLINGQTGKVVGETPIDHRRQIIFWLILFGITWVVTVLGGALFV
jgi:DNA-directed RNA polymerase subunit RPC12/RpoP